MLRTYLGDLERAASVGPILDLACGLGRNGLHLVESNIPVIFADIRSEALAHVKSSLTEKHAAASVQLGAVWQVDLESPDINPLEGRMFGGVIVYNYLHRPLLGSIKRAVYPGGVVIYETFTRDQTQYGRPRNPDFLLQAGELRDCFDDWDILYYFEGVVETAYGEGLKAVAQLVAVNPVTV